VKPISLCRLASGHTQARAHITGFFIAMHVHA
jgi:hypothetical protein